MIWSNVSRIINKVFVLVMMIVPVPIVAQTCPGNDMPDTVKAVYVKYRITDELYVRLNKEWGAPSTVVGDELKELVLWKGYEWNRRYGKYWSTDDESEKKFRIAHAKKWESIEVRQSQGEHVPMAEIDTLAMEMMNHVPENKVYEYDWIDVETPGYSLYYNRSNQKGYGVLGRRLSKSDRARMANNKKQQLDDWIYSNFKDANKVFGFNKISTSKSKMLGHDVICETVKTSFKDFQRIYNQIEICKANIKGFEVVLYQKAGEPGQQHVMEAVAVDTAYPVKKGQFCAPEYVKMRKP